MPQIDFGGLGHSAVLRPLPLTGSLNRWICGFAFGYAQICFAIAPQTSHTPKPLGDISLGGIPLKYPKGGVSYG